MHARNGLLIVMSGCIVVPLLVVTVFLIELRRPHSCGSVREKTASDLRVMANAASEFCVAKGRRPASLADVHEYLNTSPGTLARDRWGRTYLFVNGYGCIGPEPYPLDCDRHADYCIGTFGSDGRVGGEGDARDRWLCSEFGERLHGPGLHEWGDGR